MFTLVKFIRVAPTMVSKSSKSEIANKRHTHNLQTVIPKRLEQESDDATNKEKTAAPVTDGKYYGCYRGIEKICLNFKAHSS